MCDDDGRNWNYADTSRGKSKIADKPEKGRKRKEEVLHRFHMEHGTAKP